MSNLFCYKCKQTHGSNGVTVTTCFAANCDRMVCYGCYSSFCESKNITLLQQHGSILVTCPNKKCYLVTKRQCDTPQRLCWEQDGNGGPDNPNNSMRILLDWITTEGNYKRYCGKNKSGLRKTQYANSLSEKIKSYNVRIRRSPKDVTNKIMRLETQFKAAKDWINNTGQGVDDQEQFVAYVKKLCPYFDDLSPIMDDRRASRPRITLENDDDDDDKNNNNDDDDDDDCDDDDCDDDDNMQAASIDSAEQGNEDMEAACPEDNGDEEESALPKLSIVAGALPARKETKRGRSITSQSKVGESKRSVKTKKTKDDDTEFMANYTSNQGMMIRETVKHYRQLEQLQADRDKWNKKSSELQYKKDLFENFEILKCKMSKEQLLATFPDMEQFFKNARTNN